MGELLPQDRLQPSLLDRLTDDEPSSKVESRDRRVLSMAKLRECVLRDVGWLFNVTQLSVTTSLEGYPEVAKSVLNYGIPTLTGISSEGRDSASLQRQITNSINAFEPRILREGIKVRVGGKAGEMNRQALTLTIEGRLWAQPVPQSLLLTTELDLETGLVTVTDKGR